MVVTCSDCKKEFNHSSNLNRHCREQHEGKNCGKMEEIIKKIQCDLCCKPFKRKEHLQIHMGSVHSTGTLRKCSLCSYSTSNKSSLVRHENSVHKNKFLKSCEERLDFKFCCSFCPQSFKQKKYLNYHLSKKHNKQGRCLIVTKKCPLCTFASNSKDAKIMHDHFNTSHHLPLNIEHFEFDSILEFNNWKINFEKETVSKFNRSDRHKDIHSLKHMSFTCHRSGTFQSRGHGKRVLRTIGSCKINGFCPAAINASITDCGDVRVKLIRTHVGHENDLKYIFLSSNEKKLIAEKLARKVPYDEILREVRENLSNCEIKRIHLTNRKDIHNIKKCFNLSDAVKHPSDPASIEVCIREFESSNETCVLFYKPQGTEFPNFNVEDFVLLFMTKAQKQLYDVYGGHVVCVDCTHNMSSGNFKLYTLLVRDFGLEGIPIAFMFSNRADERVMQLFFKKIKETVGPIQSKVFMSDMEETFYNAWTNVMGDSRMQVLSAWHVLEAWRKIFDEKVKGKEKKAEVFKILQSLLCEINFNSFYSMVENIKTKWSQDKDLKEFGDYFFNYFVENENYKKWASCSRIGLGVNTSMAFENFSRLLRRKRVNSLEKSFSAVVNLVQHKLFHVIKSSEGKVVAKLKMLKKHHVESMRISSGTIFHQPDGEWQVRPTNSKEVYNVKKIQSAPCTECPLLCFNCKACIHQFMCSCVDHGIKINMCKHIHLVAKYTIEEDRNESLDSQENKFVTVDMIEEADLMFQDSILSIASEHQNNNVDFEKERENFIQYFSSVVRDKIKNSEQLRVIENHFKTIIPQID